MLKICTRKPNVNLVFCIKSEGSLAIKLQFFYIYMEYGDFIVGTANQNFINELDRLQDKAVRLAEYRTYENRQDISDLMNFLGIEKLEIR